MCGGDNSSCTIFEGVNDTDVASGNPTRKHAYIMLTPLKHTFIYYIRQNWGLHRNALFFLFLRVLFRTEHHNLSFDQKYEKYKNIYLKIIIFFGGKIVNIFE